MLSFSFLRNPLLIEAATNSEISSFERSSLICNISLFEKTGPNKEIFLMNGRRILMKRPMKDVQQF